MIIAGRAEGDGRQDHHHEGEAAWSPARGGGSRHMGPHHQSDWHVLIHGAQQGRSLVASPLCSSQAAEIRLLSKAACTLGSSWESLAALI